MRRSPARSWRRRRTIRPTTAAQFPTKNDLKSLTTSGSYLAARHASVERDAASAAAFYRSALRTDPKNNELLDRAFISSLAEGDIDEAVKLAERILTSTRPTASRGSSSACTTSRQKKYATAQTQHQPVDPRSDHRSGRDAAVGLGQLMAPATPRRRSPISTS